MAAPPSFLSSSIELLSATFTSPRVLLPAVLSSAMSNSKAAKGNGPKNSKFSGNGVLNRNDTMPFTLNPFVIIPSDIDMNPFHLVWLDVLSVFSLARLLPYIPSPFQPCRSGALDELAPTAANIKDLVLHAILIASQLALLLALPIITVVFWFLPGMALPLFCGAFLACTLTVMRLLNGGRTRECLVGLPEGAEPVNDEHELWFFINGVATGFVHSIFTSSILANENIRKHWLQSNLNLLAKTFQREIVGIHNPT